MKILFKWIRVVIYFCVISPHGIAGNIEPVKLQLIAVRDESLIVYLQRVYSADTSASILYVNRRFNLGPTGGQGDLELTITGVDGRKYEMEANINSILLKKRDLVSLNVDELVGVVIPLGELKNYYRLSSGEYFIKGKYINSHARMVRRNEFTGVVESEAIRIVIQ